MPSKTTVSEFAFLKRFDTEAKAVAFFESVRWPKGVICPRCEGGETYPHKSRPGYHHCRGCRKQFSCKVATIMHSSPLPVRTWLYTMYKVSVARKGISSLQLAKEIGIHQQSAWHMLQRIKEACGGEGGMLSGVVEVDETFVGGKEHNRHEGKRVKAGRGPAGKQAVVGLRQRGGRTIAKPIANTDAGTLEAVIEQHVAPGTLVYTDEHRSYNNLNRMNYPHMTVAHSAKEYVNHMAHTNGIESVWAVLKRSLVGTHHKVSVKHLHRYVNEATFRLNDGAVKRQVYDRIAALCTLSIGTRLPYRALTRGGSC